MKPERITAIFFLTVIMLFACLASVGMGFRAVEKFAKNNTPPHVNWEKLYPFKNSETHKVFKEEISFKDKLEGLKYLAGYRSIVEAARKYDEAIGWNMNSLFEYNPVVRLDDGYLTGVTKSGDVSKSVQAVRDFAAFCRENGTELIYINYPVKECKFQDEDISGKFNYANQNADRFLAMLKGCGVRCYDFREFLHDDGMEHHASFFVTDHHWKPETGLWAAGRILRLLRDDFGWNVDPEILNPDNFNYVVYRDWFLGSQGKKFTLARIKPEDITLIYPKFQTSIHLVIPDARVDTSGDFSVTYNMKQIETKDYDYYHYDFVPYNAYVYSDQSLTRITNMLKDDSKRILLIHDSFSNTVIPFLALGIRYTDAIDPRYNYRHFDGSIENFILTEKPDIVIVAYHSGAPVSTNKVFDFR